MKPHKHAGILRAIADGKEIQVRVTGPNALWHDWKEGGRCNPLEDQGCIYRIKPEPSKYPQTKMTRQEIKRAFHAADGETEKGWRGIANAAIARAIEDGQVYESSQPSSANPLGMVPKAMLEKIVDRFAEKVANDFADRYPGPNGYQLMPSEWESIAASQKVKIRAMLDSIIEAAEQGK
jgi:hypothetical protein